MNDNDSSHNELMRAWKYKICKTKSGGFVIGNFVSQYETQ